VGLKGSFLVVNVETAWMSVWMLSGIVGLNGKYFSLTTTSAGL
jgi:hypothetical protein